MALDHKSASKHVEKALSKGHIVKPLKEKTNEELEAAKVKAKDKASKKSLSKKKAKNGK